MSAATIIVNDEVIKAESLPININIQASKPGDVILIRYINRTYKVVLLETNRMILVKA